MTNKNHKRAVAMFSGGLDSILAARLVLDQGIELSGVNFRTPFCARAGKDSGCLTPEKAAQRIGIPLKVFDLTGEYLEIVKNPGYGYGKNMNPCIDCRIFTFRKAREYMQETGASYVVTGEVLGQRPMSQRPDAMRLIERESGLDGLVVRPLSARLLEPTLPERNGWLEREKFMGFNGRDRNPQIELAKKLGISDYPFPSGGCLLTYEGFANKVRDLVKYDQLNMKQARLLKIGRHFRLAADSKLIVGKDRGENERLLSLAGEGDTLLDVIDHPGPLGLYMGKDGGGLKTAAAILARYTNLSEEVRVAYWRAPDGGREELPVLPLSDSQLEQYRI